jgi:error-prone DNA polymerase
LAWGDDGPPGASGASGADGTDETDGTATAQPAVRLGLSSVRSLGAPLAARIAAAAPFTSVEDLARRGELSRAQVEALATAGALEGIATRTGAGAPRTRRGALWAAGPLAHDSGNRLPGLVTGEDAPALPELTELEEIEADMWSTGVTVGATVVELARPRLDAMGVLPSIALATQAADSRVLVGGIVTHRQRPESAKGTVFINLEDETGMTNVICSPGAWERWRDVARGAPALLVRGRLERVDGVVSVVADKITPLELGPLPATTSRDFR